MKQKFLLSLILWLSLVGSLWAQSNALHFDGNNDYVACPAINPTQFTVGAWVYPTELGKDQAIASTLSESATTGMELHIGADNIPMLTIRSGSNWVDVKGTIAVSANTWTHVAASCNAYAIYLYVNGKLDKTFSLTDGYTPGTQPLYLGRRSGASAFYFSGKIDKACIWNQIIGNSKIITLYERDITGSEAGLLAYYKFDQGTADGDNSGVTNLVDATANAKNGTLTNFALTGTTSNWVSGYTAPVHATVAVTPPALGDGTSANPYQIATIENLYWLSQNSSVWTGKFFIQTADIDLAAISNWMPIGSGFVPFTGTYDGNGHTIRNLSNNANLGYRALFGRATEGVVLKNINVENANISNTENYTAILVAYLEGLINNCHIKGGSISGKSYMGSLCGYIGNGTITNCSNSASLNEGSLVGGIAGAFYEGKIEFCHNTGAISGTNSLGGIVGYIGSGSATSSKSTITNCYNTANITNSGSSSGGIIGFCSGGTISKCYSTGTATGTSRVGGLVGYCNSEVINSVSYSYCLQSPVIGEYTANSINTFTGVSTKTASQLQTQSTFSGWDFVGEAVNGTYDYWAITSGFNGGYPTLGNLAATCTNGVVDLSRQPSGNVYSWYKTNGTKLTEGTDYIVDGGITKFLKLPGTKVYCTITNATFPNWIGRTNTVTVDKVVGPNVSFVSEKSGYLSFELGVSTIGKVYVDWGDGILVPFDLSVGEYKNLSTSNYATGNTIKIFNENITYLNLYILEMIALDVSNCTNLESLHCYANSLTSIDVSKNTNLQTLTLSNNSLTSIDVSKNINLKEFHCNNNSLTLLNVSNNTNLQYLDCGNNDISSLDVSQNSVLWELDCADNQFAFATLPQPKYAEYTYAPQANLTATCTGGIVDLSSQLTAKDGSDQTQTTVYTWYNANGTALIKGTDYDGKDGKFYFMKQPASTVYCNMTNAAFSNLTLRTTDITVDAVFTPAITFAAASFTGDFSIHVSTTELATIFIDKGDGERKAYTISPMVNIVSISSYTAGNTIKIFRDKINYIALTNIGITSLDVSNATALRELYCPNQLLNFQTLPQPKSSYTTYMYAPQSNFAATCTNGIVDLSSQLTAKDASGQTQTTVYAWYNADDTELVKGTDYNGKDGKFYFLKQPASTIYCKMYNAAFPDLSGDNAFRTTDITVDKVLVPKISFVSDETMCNLTLGVSTPGSITIDSGDGSLQVFDIATTKEITINTLTPGVPARIFGDNITMFTCLGYGLTSIDVSNTPELQDLNCSQNKLTSLDVSKNTALQRLYCRNNNFNLTTLPQVKAAYYTYSYDPQNYFPATCTKGVVDLSSQLTAKDENGHTHTTVYTWYNVDGIALTANVDYIEDNGVFTFIKMPAEAEIGVYCSMTNAAFPGFALLTVNITVDAVLEPSITLVSDNTGDLSFGIALKEAGKVYIDWGNGNINEYNPVSFQLSVSNYSYFSGNTVNVYCNNISDLNVANQGITSLELNNNPNLNSLECQNNKFNFKTLSNIKGNIATFSYSPQSNLTVACTNGVVDMSDQLTATDLGGSTLTTAYSWFLADNTPLTAGTDYIEEAGVFRFVKMPAQTVYCTLTNAAFPALTLRTVDMTVDAVVEPNIRFVSENNGDLSVYLNVSEQNTVYVDWGNGILESLQYWEGYPAKAIATTEYVANSTVKIYGKSINFIDALSQGITSLNVSNASKLTKLLCPDNKLTSLDVSKNNTLTSLQINENRFSFATLPQSKTSYTDGYWYYSQANLAATCTNGVVNLSSQLTAKDIDGNQQTTSYAFFRTEDDQLLNEGEDYMVNQGKIYFLTVPASDVYCQMKNEAFPGLTLRTADLTVDRPATLPEPTIKIISENNGTLSFYVQWSGSGGNTVYVDWGNGVLLSYTDNFISTNTYVAGNTVKVYGENINYFDASAQGLTALDLSNITSLTTLYCYQNKLSSLDVSQNTGLTYISCYDNNLGALDVSQNTVLTYLNCFDNNISSLNIDQNTVLATLDCSDNKLTTLDVNQNTSLEELICTGNQLNFSTLPQAKASYSDYSYAPQQNIAAICTNGIVDLSSQLTAVDVDGNTQTTVYSWYLADGTELTNNYMPENGVFRFVLEPGTVVYCQMTNDAFSGLTLRTENITIDAKATLPEPTISFVSENSGSVNISVDVAENSTVYIDWGDGSLASIQAIAASMNEVSTANYVANRSVKVYNSQLVGFYADTQGLTAINTQNAPELVTLECRENKLEEIDLSNNVKLSKLKLYQNKLDNLDVSLLKELKDLTCSSNNLSTLDIQYNTKLEWLNCEFNNLSKLDISHNPELDELFCYNNKLTISSLPQVDFSTFWYAPQANLLATCTNGIVDLSSQLTAVDKEGTTQTTVYTWYKTGNSSSLTKGTDYVEYNGVFRFLQQPDTTVYCQMTNAAFPLLALHTVDITVDAVLKPSVTFTSSKNGDLSFFVTTATIPQQLFVDWGDGNLVSYEVNNQNELITTSSYLIGRQAKIFAGGITDLGFYEKGIELFDVSNCPQLGYLNVASNNISSLDVTNNLELYFLNCSLNDIGTLDVSKNTKLEFLYCSYNGLSTLDLSNNTLLSMVDCEKNRLSLATLPQNKSAYMRYYYNSQANLNVPCHNGMVDLSSQLTATDVNNEVKTTVYTWYNADGTALVKGVDYNGKDGRFYFTKQPVSTVYCSMTNAAFPDFTGDNIFRTMDITVDAVLTPNITFVSENSGSLNLVAKVITAGRVYVDWGYGALVPFDVTTEETTLSTDDYTAGNTAKVFGINISYMDINSNGITALDVSNAVSLATLNCTSNSLTFASLLQPSALFTLYTYAPQAKLAATCTNGVVNLSSQLTALDINNVNQTTVYSWYNADGTPFTNYIENDGVFEFTTIPTSTIYCTMTNAAFPDLAGNNILRTTDITIDVTIKSNIDFVSKNTSNLDFNIALGSAGKVYVDWGNGDLVSFDVTPSISTLSTTAYTAYQTVKIYGENITYFDAFDRNLTALNVSNATALTELRCNNNSLESLDISKNINLRYLLLNVNKLKTLDLSHNANLKFIYCTSNQFTIQSLPQPKASYSFYSYAPQAKLAAVCSNGVVDLSSQLTAKDASGIDQTTIYTWYNADDTELTASVDYIVNNGVFTFISKPVSAVYCKMTNAAFPNFTGLNIFRTVDITVELSSTVPITESIEDRTFSSTDNECFGATQTIVIAENGNNVVFQNGSHTNLIAGQSICFLPGTVMEPGAYVHACITTDGSFCDRIQESIVSAEPETEKSKEIMPDNETIAELQTLKVFPNPSDGRFTLQTTGLEGSSILHVYNSLGAEVYKALISAEERMELTQLKKGLYIVNVINNQTTLSQRIILK